MIMAELAAVAGIVGILGFGVQVCQGLWDYYQAYKDQDEAVAKMLASVAQLQRTCGILSSTVASLEGKPYPKESIESLKKSVQNCEDSFKHLEKKLNKVKSHQKPSVTGVKKWVAKMGKPSYPFKESTLVKLREITNESVGSLDLAVDTLSLYVPTRLYHSSLRRHFADMPQRGGK
jgi:ankyrin repeat domain-containing protein 50